MAVIKRVLCPQRLRKVPSQFSWIDHRLVRDRHICRCSHPALALYLFLVAVCDGQGLSYYSDPSIMRLLRLEAADLARARQELINAKLIAYQCPLYQVLALESVPQASQRRKDTQSKDTQTPGRGEPKPPALTPPSTPAAWQSPCATEPSEPTRLDQILRRLIDSAQDGPFDSAQDRGAS